MVHLKQDFLHFDILNQNIPSLDREMGLTYVILLILLASVDDKDLKCYVSFTYFYRLRLDLKGLSTTSTLQSFYFHSKKSTWQCRYYQPI